jgi:hypothetical protein
VGDKIVDEDPLYLKAHKCASCARAVSRTDSTSGNLKLLKNAGVCGLQSRIRLESVPELKSYINPTTLTASRINVFNTLAKERSELSLQTQITNELFGCATDSETLEMTKILHNQ